MNRRRILVVAAVALCAALWTYACGDGATGPPSPPPDPPRPASVAVAPATVRLAALGATDQLTAEVRDQNGNAMAGAAVSWASSAAAVATVSTSGLVTAAGNGMATITATAGSASGTAAVTVAQEVSAVAVTPAADTLVAGDTLRLAAEAADANGHPVAGVELGWASSDTLVAVVDYAGLVTGVGGGEAEVTATAAGVAGGAQLTVLAPAPTTIAVTPDTVALTALGQTAQLVAEVRDQAGRVMEGVPVSWSSADTLVATVDSAGLVVAIGGGATTITATAGDARGTAEITVANPDRAVLVALYHATDGAYWVDNTNWLSDAPLGEWHGVSVNAGGRVTGLRLVRNGLSGMIPPEIGNLTELQYLTLAEHQRLSGPIPSTLENLHRLRRLGLSYNRLSGPIPPELGNLVNLTVLTIGGNRLSGPVPRSFLGLGALQDFWFGGQWGEGADLCVPGRADFVAWLKGHTESGGPFCNESDITVLESLYDAAGGSEWTAAGGWLASAATAEWHGVHSDSLGRVQAIDLVGNGLSGRLPQSLGQLTQMTGLRIGDNVLSGRLPKSLMELSLRELHYGGTDLCVPGDATFSEWLRMIPSLEGTGVACARLSEREILEVLYDVTGGSSWNNSAGWLTTPLSEWHGVSANAEGRVTELLLAGNNLSGAIPSELGGLGSLRQLHLSRNSLTGSIPPELGDVENLGSLDLGSNELTGSIPAELGGLGSLRQLDLSGNGLAGSIPPELGDLESMGSLDLGSNELTGSIPPELSGLRDLSALDLSGNAFTGSIPSELGALGTLRRLGLQRNDLTGPIPPALGNLASLVELQLADNDLTGPIPAQLTGLVNLTQLHLGGNQLTGSVPSELGNLANLFELLLGNNPEMAGVLPADLTALGRLDGLVTSGTGLCAPSDDAFKDWLRGIRRLQVEFCESPSPSAMYLTQAVQSPESTVPLVAGRQALLRVFVTAPQSTDARVPSVRARFHVGDSEVHVANIAASPALIPTEMNEGDLEASSNAVIPGEIVRPGLEVVIEIDPEGTLDPALGVVKRIPETGRLALDVRAMPTLDLTLIPFLWSSAPDSQVVDKVRDMAASPEEHEMLWHARTLLPVGDLDVTPHAPVLTATNDAYQLLAETEVIRVMEGGTGHYMGMMSGRIRSAGGVARRYGRSAFSTANLVGTLAHELGHNMGLWHAPCGRAGGVDPAFPHKDGSIGAWGYDFRGRRMVRPDDPDLMSYCGPWWISGYHFTNAVRFRLNDEGGSGAEARTTPVTSLILWGGSHAEGVPYLEPAFVADVPPLLPDSAGEHRITGRTADSDELFSIRFAMPAMADGDGSASFAFALPVKPHWADYLASITLSGPGGSATLDGDTDSPIAIIRDTRTGQVRAVLRDPAPATQASADLARQVSEQGMEVLFSRSIPGADAWRR